jgi:signal transduction histidine kinase
LILLKQFMAWVTASNRSRNRIFQGLRWRLLLSYLSVMAAILLVFATWVYVFFTRSLFRQLDDKLLTLDQAAAPSLGNVKISGGQPLDQEDEVPWRDIFNRNEQSLEWFDADRKLLARKGALSLAFVPETGARTVHQSHKPSQIRTFTISVYNDALNRNHPSLEGYIRASQSTKEVETVQSKLRWGLGMGGVMALGLVGIGGLWLTRRALEPIEQSFKHLKQFTADASHELRSPLTAIKTSVDVMLNHPERIHPKDAKKLAAIASATAQMTYLAEDLLLLARTDAAVTTIAREWIPIPLSKVLQDLVELYEPLAFAKGITLKSHWLADVSAVGDAAQITRLFSKLLENALQYTPSGGTVVLSLARHNRSLVVSVKDTGVGIAPEQQPFVFDRFWRADKARFRREGGMGLGLAIAMAIAKHHGGEITLTSRVGVGSCFRVRLPVG